MHSSLILFTLASSVLAAPVIKSGDIVHAPVDITAPINGVANAAVNVVAPVKAAVGNIAAQKINVGNDNLSGNHADVDVRDVVHAPIDIYAPVKAVTDATAYVKAPVEANVANVNLKDIKGLNGIASGNKVNAREDVTASADAGQPVNAAGGIVNEPVGIAHAVVPTAEGTVVPTVNSVPGDASTAVLTVEDTGAPVVDDVQQLFTGPNVIISDNKITARYNVVNAPTTAKVPVNAAAHTVAKVVAPVDADVANVYAENIDVANGNGSGNKINARGGNTGNVVNAPADVKAPVNAIAEACADVYAPVKAAVGNADVKDVKVANGVLSGNTVHA